MTEGSKEFGEIKALCLAAADDTAKEIYLQQMRDNLLKRNGNNSDTEVFYPTGKHVDILQTTDPQDLYAADNFLNNHGL